MVMKSLKLTLEIIKLSLRDVFKSIILELDLNENEKEKLLNLTHKSIMVMHY